MSYTEQRKNRTHLNPTAHFIKFFIVPTVATASLQTKVLEATGKQHKADDLPSFLHVHPPEKNDTSKTIIFPSQQTIIGQTSANAFHLKKLLQVLFLALQRRVTDDPKWLE